MMKAVVVGKLLRVLFSLCCCSVAFTNMPIDLSQIEDWEKAAMLQVLRRNERVKQCEERRLEQIAVRVQLERLNDRRSPQMECQLKTMTGEWHREMLMKRSSQPYDVSRHLYRRISSDLTSTASRKHSDSQASTTSLRQNDDACQRSLSEDPQYHQSKLQDVHIWVQNHIKYSNNRSNGLRYSDEEVKNGTESDQER